ILREELFEGLGVEVFEDGSLAFFPGVVQGAGSARSAGAVFHNAAGYTERPLDGLHGLPERYLRRRARQPGTSSATLLALDQVRVREPDQDAGQQAAWNVGLGR